MSRNRRGSPIATTADVMLLQEAMRQLTLYEGPVDGIAGTHTMRAVRRYKQRHGFMVDNSLESELIEHVRRTV